MLGWRRSGLRPDALGGRPGALAERRLDEDAAARAEEDREAEQDGGRVRRDLAHAAADERTGPALDHTESSVTHSSSEPSCDDQTAVAR